MKQSFIICVLIFGLACSGGADDEVRIQLTAAERDRYQAIASERLDSIRPLLDSLCKATFEDRVAIATDSIVQRRLEEEARLRRRIGQTIPQ